jgi:hypothetical protein
MAMNNIMGILVGQLAGRPPQKTLGFRIHESNPSVFIQDIDPFGQKGSDIL